MGSLVGELYIIHSLMQAKLRRVVSAKDKRDFKMIAVNYDIPRNTHKLHCGLNSRCGSFFSLLICLS